MVRLEVSTGSSGHFYLFNYIIICPRNCWRNFTCIERARHDVDYETRKLYRQIDLTSKLLRILARFTFDFQVAFLTRYAMILYWKSGQKSWIRKLMFLLTIRVKVLYIFFLNLVAILRFRIVGYGECCKSNCGRVNSRWRSCAYVCLYPKQVAINYRRNYYYLLRR